MIRFSCPQCGGTLGAPEDNRGEEINCIGCGQRVQVPLPSDGYFRFPCPSCGKRLKAQPKDTGKKTRCTKCGTRFAVPPADPPRTTEGTFPKPRAAVEEPVSSTVTFPKGAGPMPITVSCSSCGASLKAPDNAIGKWYKCPRCSTPVRVPDGPSSGPLPDRIKPAESSRVRSAPPPVRVPPQPAAEVNVQLVRADTKNCPFCGEQVLSSAKKCKHCGETIDVVLRAEEEAKRASENQAAPMVFMNASSGAAASSSRSRGEGQTIIVAAQKSVFVAILLTFLFGPLGMFYSTVAGGLIMMGINFFVVMIAVCTGGAGALLFLMTWPICILWAAIAASNHKPVRVIRD